jgi:predicted Ser/Thr protein kinase
VTPSPERWSRAKSIFGAAIEIDPSQREAYVRKVAGHDEALFVDVISLLKADSTDTIFTSPVARSGVSELLNGRYRVERELGRGGLGVVYLARDQSLYDRPVVIKMQLEHTANEPWMAGKFAEEVKALARIDHPGVVGALDNGRTADGRPFLVMQYVEGRPLQGTIPSEGVPLEWAGDLLKQIGQALGAAHAKGVWHRDLKPANIMLRQLETGEQVRLIDFGIATVRDGPGGEIGTRAAGTPPYMSPEQLEGRASAASDIWAMGVVAYELVCGRRPFVAETAIQLQEMQRAGPSIRPTQLRPGLSAAAEALILRALSYRPQDRPADAAAFGAELAAAITAAQPQARTKTRRAAVVGIAAAAAAAVAAARSWGFRGAPRHSFAYSVMVQAMRNGNPDGRPTLMPPTSQFRPSDEFFLLVRPAEAGHLCLLSDDAGADTMTTLFPSPFMNGGSSRLNANEQKQLPEKTSYYFDEKPGTIEFWFVWSLDPLPELEKLVRWVNDKDRGSVGDASERKRVRDWIREAAAAASVTAGTESKVESKAAAFAWKVSLQTRSN